jgi:hypothetical protein
VAKVKGIVAELHNSYMIVITEKGDFIRHKKISNCKIGDEVNIKTVSFSKLTKQISTLAASFIIIAMLITGTYAYYSPYSYVSIDINPSLGLSVNRFDKVIAIKPLNEDAKQLLSSSGSINNKSLNDAVAEILETAYDSGYLKSNEENSVMFVISTDNEKEELKLSQEVEKVSSEQLSKLSNNYNIIIEKAQVEEYKNAIGENLSPGKVMLINEVKNIKPDMQLEEVKQMSVQQVMSIIKEARKEDKKQDKDDKIKETDNDEVDEDEDKDADEKKDKDKKEDGSNNGNGKGSDKKSNGSSVDKKEDKNKEDKNKEDDGDESDSNDDDSSDSEDSDGSIKEEDDDDDKDKDKDKGKDKNGNGDKNIKEENTNSYNDNNKNDEKKNEDKGNSDKKNTGGNGKKK